METLFIMPHLQVFFWIVGLCLAVVVVAGAWWLFTYIPYKIASNEYKGFAVGDGPDYNLRATNLAQYTREKASWEASVQEAQRLRNIRNEAEDRIGPSGDIVGIALIPSILLGLILAGMLIPYNPKYWHFYELKGEVVSITNVFSAEKSELVSDAVVTLEGYDTPLVVSDPRILLYEGEEVSFRCDWEWVPGGEDQLGCLIAEYPKS